MPSFASQPAPAWGPANAGLPVGFRLPGYRILRRLSSGAFGVVYLAERNDGQRVALKEFLPRMYDCRRPEDHGRIVLRQAHEQKHFATGMRAFFREADILAQLNDPRVIPIWDVFEANGTAYLTMPVERGCTLKDALWHHHRRGSVAPPWARLFREAALGVEALHAHGLLHLDLKPNNLWWRPDDTVVVLDLGASRWHDEDPFAPTVTTQGFAAPEQYLPESAKPDQPVPLRHPVSERTDVYGLSATLWACIEGVPPLHALHRSRQADPIQTWFQQRVGQHPMALLRLVVSGMALTPDERPKSIQAWRQQLEALGPTTPWSWPRNGHPGAAQPWNGASVT